MTESQTIELLTDLMGKCGLHYAALAIACGVSPTTTRQVLASGRLPARSHARQRLEAFASANRNATTRTDLRFV